MSAGGDTDPARISLRFAGFELRAAQRLLLERGQPVELGVRAMDVLIALALRRERVVGSEELIELAWPGLFVEPNNLQVQISALRKRLGPEAISTVKRRGYQFTARIEALGDEGLAANPGEALATALSTSTPASTPAATPASIQQAASNSAATPRLPATRTRFIGRVVALEEGARLLANSRLLTLTGPGGSGKTRLAIELARRQAPAFDGEVHFADLSAWQSSQGLPTAVATGMGLRFEGATAPLACLVSRIGARRMLLVLDNCEHLIGPVAELADGLLSACAGLHLLATSREGLGLAGEQLWPVRPMALPASDTAEALREAEAVQLFVDAARRVQPGFSLADDGQAAVVADICRRLDGLALAIELAAARVRMFPVEEIRARLDDRLRFLTGSAQALPRHRTLSATLQWSARLLSPQELAVWASLSILPGGCTLATARAMAGLADDYETLQLLTQLHDKSLLYITQDLPHEFPPEISQELTHAASQDRPSDEPSERRPTPRFRMLETVRQYARGLLDDSGESKAVHARGLAHFLALAEAAGEHLHGPQEMEWLPRVSTERDNLVAAHGWCAALPQGAEAGWRLVVALSRHWTFIGPLDLGHRLGTEALAREAPQIDDVLRGQAWLSMALMAHRRGHYAEALGWAERAVALAETSGDEVRRASALSSLGGALHALGRNDEALVADQAATRLLREAGVTDKRLVVTLNNLAELYRSLGRHAQARELYEEAIARSRSLHIPSSVSHLLCNLARLQTACNELPAARASLTELAKHINRHRLQKIGGWLADVAGCLASALGDPEQAARMYGMAKARLQESGERRDPVDEAFLQPRLAATRAALGDARFDAAVAAGHALGWEASNAAVAAWLASLPAGD